MRIPSRGSSAPPPWLALVALAALPACSLVNPAPATSRYYTLSADAGPAAADPVASLGLGPVRLPAYLDRPQIVTRAGPDQIDLASHDRWAAPLADLFWQALAEDLRATWPARQVLRHPWAPAAAPEAAVSVEVLRFERDAKGAAVLWARWSVERRDGRRPAAGETRLREEAPEGDVAASVAAMSRAVAALARDVAAAGRAGP
jgi:hypothetical protein